MKKPKRIELQFAEDDPVYLELKDRADKLGLSPRMYIEQLLRADYWSRRGVDIGSVVRLSLSGHQDAASGQGSANPQPAESPTSEAQLGTRPGAVNLARSFVVPRPQRREGEES